MNFNGQRTFLLASAALGGAFLLAILGKLTGDFSTVASVAVGAYAGKSAWVTGKGNDPGTDASPDAEPGQ